MDWIMILKAVLSLAFVLGLLLVVLWLLKYCELRGARTVFSKSFKQPSVCLSKKSGGLMPEIHWFWLKKTIQRCFCCWGLIKICC